MKTQENGRVVTNKSYNLKALERYRLMSPEKKEAYLKERREYERKKREDTLKVKGGVHKERIQKLIAYANQHQIFSFSIIDVATILNVADYIARNTMRKENWSYKFFPSRLYLVPRKYKNQPLQG